MRIVIAGASGFLGSHLSTELRRRGHAVTALVRRASRSEHESSWDPYTGSYDPAVIAEADVVVNLAGSPTAGNPHSASWARNLRESRIVTTQVLADAIAGTDDPPAFLAGNGISWYGDHGSEVLTEQSDSRGTALLTEVTREWQAATEAATVAGSRVCILRTAPVMDRRAAPLKQLKLAFQLGLGARLGDGNQYMAMISLRDWVGAVAHLAEHPSAHGAFNLCCPEAPTNREFTAALAEAVRRPAFVVAPSSVLRVAAGHLAPELLGSLNVRPAALRASGYQFQDRDVRAVLAVGLG